MTHCLTGKTITGVKLSEDGGAILFITEEEEIRGLCDADGYSHTWVEHVELPALGFPAKVISVEDLALPLAVETSPDYGSLKLYGCKVATEKGEIIIDYRNSSNGYYGGSISWPGEPQYNQVLSQKPPVEKWLDVREEKHG